MSLRISGQFRFHILVPGETIMRLSRHIRETIDQVFRLVGTAQGTPSPTPCATPSWVVRAPLPYFARGIFVVSDGTFVYAGGGFDGLTNQVHNDLLRFDFAANSWTALAPSPDQHFLSQAVIFDGKIYDIAGDAWTTGAPLPEALSDMATTVWNWIIYVAGGFDGVGEVNTLYAFNIATNSWTTLAPLPQALALPGFGAIDGKLYIASGNNGGNELDTLYIYDIASNTWSTGGTGAPTSDRGQAARSSAGNYTCSPAGSLHRTPSRKFTTLLATPGP